jgi:hypothetical protein
MIPYGMILIFLVGPLVYRYATTPDRADGPRRIVVGIAAGSFLAAMFCAPVSVVAWVVFAGVGVYVVVEREMRSSGPE